MKKIIIICILFLSLFNLKAQEKLPFYEIPKQTEEYTAQAVVMRQIAALGFRFYWASEGLTEKDLQYKPTPESKSTLETIKHIYNMSFWMLTLTETEHPQPKKTGKISLEELRKATLNNYQALSNRVKNVNDLKELSIKSKFFQIINGPISDSIWHSGQIATFRRITGNPINSNISHFTGTVKK
jgi:hypothetical protein